MRYPAGHKAKARSELLSKSAAHAKKHGFGKSGVDSLAAAAGVTSGAFYSHFSGKDQFLAALIEAELLRTRDLFAAIPPGARDMLVMALDGYLSRSHVNKPETGCPLPSLAVEVGRAQPEVRESYETALLQVRDALAAHLGSPEAAWVVISQCAGAVMLARALATESSQRELLCAVRAHLKAVALAE